MDPSRYPGLVRAARAVFQEKIDLFSETCRRDCYCIPCKAAFCAHCCGFHHAHVAWHCDPFLLIHLGADGLPVFPTKTADGHPIPRIIADKMAAQDYTSRVPRDAFCLGCMREFCSEICSHHHGRDERLPDAVLRVEEHGGRRCVRCTGSEWWMPHMGRAFGDPVRVDEEAGYELLPVQRMKPGNCIRCDARISGQLPGYCSKRCLEINHRDIEETTHRREARHAARHVDKS